MEQFHFTLESWWEEREDLCTKHEIILVDRTKLWHIRERYEFDDEIKEYTFKIREESFLLDLCNL